MRDAAVVRRQRWIPFEVDRNDTRWSAHELAHVQVAMNPLQLGSLEVREPCQGPLRCRAERSELGGRRRHRCDRFGEARRRAGVGREGIVPRRSATAECGEQVTVQLGGATADLGHLIRELFDDRRGAAERCSEGANDRFPADRIAGHELVGRRESRRRRAVRVGERTEERRRACRADARQPAEKLLLRMSAGAEPPIALEHDGLTEHEGGVRLVGTEGPAATSELHGFASRPRRLAVDPSLAPFDRPSLDGEPGERGPHAIVRLRSAHVATGVGTERQRVTLLARTLVLSGDDRKHASVRTGDVEAVDEPEPAELTSLPLVPTSAFHLHPEGRRKGRLDRGVGQSRLTSPGRSRSFAIHLSTSRLPDADSNAGVGATSATVTTAATIVFFPEGAYGPTNNCVGIGQVLRERGHRVVFIVEESFAGSLEAQGFEERLMRLGPAPDVEEAPGQFWKDFIRDTAPVFRTPTIEQLESFIEPTFRALCDGATYVDERLREIFDEVQPSLIVEDNVVCFPAIHASGRPWARIVSCNPLELQDPGVPPVFSGYPAADRSGWDAFRAEYLRTHADLHAEFSEFCVERGAPPLPAGSFIHTSDTLNLYVYPEEIDYRREQPLGPLWHRLDSCVREVESSFALPEQLAAGGGKLVYLSLGSLGSADVELMRRLVDVLSGSRHRFIVSKGPQHDEFDLADNMWGEEFLPQPAILPLVDLVITHGGNNTTTECLHTGKPMVALPLFWDQMDNAQRVDETGVGLRFEPYTFAPDALLAGIDRLLADDALHARLRAMATRIRQADGRTRAASLIERVALEDRGG